MNRWGRTIPWHDASAPTESDLSRIPRMEADVLLDSQHRRIVLDTKFYPQALGGKGGAHRLHSANLYQILAYLRNRQSAMPDGPRHDGILLYPVVGHPIAIEVRLEGFRIQARGIDLAQPWQQIHEDLLGVLGEGGVATHPGEALESCRRQLIRRLSAWEATTSDGRAEPSNSELGNLSTAPPQRTLHLRCPWCEGTPP